MTIDDLRRKADELRLGTARAPSPGPHDPNAAVAATPALASGIATLVRQVLPLVVEALLLRRDQPAAHGAPPPPPVAARSDPPPPPPPPHRARWKSIARTTMIAFCAGLAGYAFWRLDGVARLRRALTAPAARPLP